MKLQKLLSLTRQAVEDYGMISQGDKIAVGVSGGKDSLTLLYALSHLRSFYPKHFDLMAVTVDLGFPGADFDDIREFCHELEVPYHVISTQIAPIIFDVRKDRNPCSLCAKMRKGAMNDYVKELGCNKVAFAHHKDDLIESMMMSFIYEGKLRTFSPVTSWDRSGLVLIRPLIYLYEGEIKGFVREVNIKILKNPCPVDGSTKRSYVKEIIRKINYDNPGAKTRMNHAILEGLVDPFCLRKSGNEENDEIDGGEER